MTRGVADLLATDTHLYALDYEGMLWSWDSTADDDLWAGWDRRSLSGRISHSISNLLKVDQGGAYCRLADGSIARVALDGRASDDPTLLTNEWSSAKCVFLGGSTWFYVLTEDGSLLAVYKDKRERHEGFFPAAQVHELATGWDRFTRVVGSEGSFFAIGPTGEMLAFRHVGAKSGGWSEGSAGIPLNVAGWPGLINLTTNGPLRLWGISGDGRAIQFDLEPSGEDDPRIFICSAAEIGAGWPIGELTGYAWPISVSPGGTTHVYVSCPQGCSATAQPLLSHCEGTSPIPLTAVQLPAQSQVTRSDWQERGCGWQRSLSLRVPLEWPTGLYSVQLVHGTEKFDVVLVVRPLRPERDIVTVVSTNTWNAYNYWGAISKYGPRIPRRLTFLRPNPVTDPESHGAINHLTASDLWILDWMNSEGFSSDLVTDWELHEEANCLKPYKIAVLLTHPEYWTHQMRDHVEEFLAQGGSLAYLGGNGLFEVCSLSDDGTMMSVFGGCSGVDRRGAFFRNANPPRPERDLLGVAFRFDSDWKADPLTHVAVPYSVLEPKHVLFEGLDLEKFDLIGTEGRNGGAACGWEMDTSLPGSSDGALVSALGLDDRGISPEDCIVLARGTESGYSGDMTVYKTPQGGHVFAAGSICFGGSLSVDLALQRVVRNFLNMCLDG